jgi:viologen exporter family transport system permease protein
MRGSWGIYRALTVAFVRSRLQYPLSFWLSAVTATLADVAPLLLIGIVFTRFPTIRGWHWREIALLYGLGQVSVALMRCFATQIDKFDDFIVSGEFDSFLIRPLPPLFHLIAARFELTQISRVFCGMVILALAARAARVPFTLANIALALAAVVGGTMMLVSLTLMVATLSFWHTRTGKLQDFVQSSGREFANYPLTIYPTSVRWILTLVVPLALITYYPAQRLLGVNETGALLPVLALAALPMGALFLFLAACLWHVGLRHYQSTGS